MKLLCKVFLGATALTLLLIPFSARLVRGKSAKNEYLMYVGTYTGPKSKGIYAFRFQPETGTSTPVGLVAETASPSFLIVHPSRPFLYAVNEISKYEGQNAGSLSAFAIDAKTGQLKFINRVSSRGSGPCHLAVDRTGKWLVTANYGGGSVAVNPIKADGSLGEATSFIQHSGGSVDQSRQKEPHAHSVNFSPDNRLVLVSDLGLDQVLIYRLDPIKGMLTANNPAFAKVKGGAGPRHFAFHPNKRFGYVINEIDSTVTAFNFQPSNGALNELQTISTLPKDYTGKSYTAEIEVHPNGKFLYGSNRGHDSIMVFSIDPRKGSLTPVEAASTQGKTPRNFALDPTGGYLLAANQGSDNIVIFKIDQKTGKLSPTGSVLEAPSPVCVAFHKIQ